MTVAVGRIGTWSAVRLWPEDRGEAADVAAELEELGYQTIWLGGTPAGTLEWPAAVLEATRTVTVATGIVSVWESPAHLVAAARHRLVTAHPDRFLLGLGASHAPPVEAAGQAYQRPYHKLVEFLDGLDAAQPPVPPDGRVLAALGPRMLALAATRTAGAHPYLTTPEHTRRAREILGTGPLLAPEQMVVLETGPSRAREIARATVARYLRLPNYTSNLARLGYTEEDISQVSNRLVDALVVWGDEAAISVRVAAHYAAGADHVCVQVLTGQPGLPLAGWRALAPALT